MERLDAAERMFLTVVEKDPASWRGWGNLAGIYERTGRVDDARKAFEQILRLRPGDARAQSWLAAHP